ncbi:uncharacterized protein LOC110027865 isoform X2 [Phalaenopsis equestris]|uniref:uncharacterized protein LOC110027865 isoform X2 n=1 Tax=Phalaenopsis equestris TaxID=78828 RepID=UPI0009E56101|nr:uncharacterized protein LOC110027865 isoform X2 [Phalaenopsis equestris]
MGTAEQVTKASSRNTFPAVGSAEEIRVRRRTLEVVLEQCHRALEQLQMSEDDGYLAEEDTGREGESNPSVSSSALDNEADELCNLVKFRVESAAFLEKLGSIDISACPDVSDDSASWDMVTSNDLWDDKQILVDNESDEDSYVLIRQEEIVDGIACFMAAYLLSLKDSKELTPNQLQEALCKTFSGKKRKSRLRKAWDGSKVIYNVASWSATAFGIYQNPALLRAASVVFSTSFRAISKLL